MNYRNIPTNMSSGIRTYLVLLILYATLQSGSCLKCFSCTSLSHEGCGPYIKETEDNLKECQPNQLVCLKIVGNDNPELEVRLCGSPRMCKGFSDCHYCDTDVCNSAWNVLPSLNINIMFTLSMVLFWINN